jgi:hypothetical protein
LLLLLVFCAARPASAQNWCFRYQTYETFEFHTLSQWSVWNNSTGSVRESTLNSFPSGGTSASFYLSQFDAPSAFIVIDHPYDAHFGFYQQSSHQLGCPFDIPKPVGTPKYCSMGAYIHADSHVKGSIQMLDPNYFYQAVQSFDLPIAAAGEWRFVGTPTIQNCSQNMIARIELDKPGLNQENRAFVDYVTVNWWY